MTTEAHGDPWIWWYRIVLFWVGSSDFAIGIVLTIQSDGRLYSTPSMMTIRAYTWPWPVWGALWLIAAVLLVVPKSRAGGYFAGLILTSFFSLYCLAYGVFLGHIGNVVIAALATQSALMQLGGLRYLAILRTRPKVAATYLDSAT